MFVPPVWGWIADRTQRPSMLLKISCVAAALAFVPMLWSDQYPYAAVLAVMGVYAVLLSPITPLADTIAVSVARELGTEYSRLRLWGSIGYIISVWCFSRWLSEHGGVMWQVIPAALTLMCVYVFASSFIEPPKERFHRSPPTFADARRLLTQPPIVFFFLAELVHWAALSAFYMLYAMHLQDLGFGQYIGMGHGLGAAAEVVLMWSFTSIRKRVPLLFLLGTASVVSSLRWLIISRIESGPALACVQLLHCFSFGTCYVGSIAYLEQTVPPSLLATGRALFSAVVMGLGGMLGNSLAGTLYDWGGGAHGGGRAAFTGSALLELLVPLLLIASWLASRRRAEESATALPAPSQSL
jgi:PPP family 3-phenylpropionic acid transporter